VLLISSVKNIFAALTSSNRRNTYKNIPFRLTTILFSFCLICLSTGICQPNAVEAAITLDLFQPEYSACGNVSINGFAGTASGIITRLSWDWGDGIVADSFFPATHRYKNNSSYTVTVTAFCSMGETQSTSTLVNITNAEDPLCDYALMLYPSTFILRNGKTSEPLHIELRDADGAPVSMKDKTVSYTSSNPSIVHIDASGVVTGSGFGEAQITVTVEGFPLTAKASVFAGEFRIEPAILLLSPFGQPTGQLNLKVANADGSPLNLTGRTVTFHGSNAVAQANESGLVTAVRPLLYFSETPYISADIDGIWSHNAPVIRVTSDPLNLNMFALQEPNIIFYIPEQIGSFDYQQIFQDFDVPRITNIAYKIEEELCGLVPFQGDVQYFVNDPGHGQDGTVPCGISGNPVRLGTDVDKSIHNSCLIVAFPPAIPQWGVFFHEMGHNFTFGSLSFGEFTNSSNVDNSNITYSEGLATAVSMYVGQMMSERAIQYHILPEVLSTIMSAVWHFGITPDLDTYVNNGAKYSTITASVLDDIISVLADEYEYSILPRFFSVFLPPDASFGLFALSRSDTNQATFFAAAMSAAVGTDLRADFINKWGFPVDNSSFDQIYSQLQKLITQHTPLAGNTKISVSPKSLNFGSLKTGNTSDPKTITIRNTGKGNLTIYSIIIEGTNASEFNLSYDSSTIFPGDSCTINVSFTPALPFGKKSTTMVIFSNDPNKPAVNINLSGKAPPPKISVSPKSLNFGSVTVGHTSASKTITIKNNGTSDLVISDINIMGINAGEFSEKSFCNEISKGESCTIDVTFASALLGKKSASIGISSNDPKKPFINVKLNGTGI
jgi:PKD repeat protein